MAAPRDLLSNPFVSNESLKACVLPDSQKEFTPTSSTRRRSVSGSSGSRSTAYGVRLNPRKGERFTLGGEDKVIVLAEA
jgi:hypothetical protein